MSDEKENEENETLRESVNQTIEKLKAQASEENELAQHTTEGSILNHRQRAIAHLAALGFTNREIAKQLGVNTARITTITRSQSFQQEVERIQDQIFFKDPQKVFMKILPRAMARAYEVMMSKKTKDHLVSDVAFKFMDRALGKPLQEVKHESGGLRELLEKLDAQKQPKTIEAKAIPIEDAQVNSMEDAITDEVEKFVKENFS